MATITKRYTKRRGWVFTAQIRMTLDGEQYTECKTDSDERFVNLWAAKREAEIRRDGIAHVRHSGTTVRDVLQWYKDDFQGELKFGRTKLAHVNFLMSYPGFADLDAIALTPQQLIAHARTRAADRVSPATINNDFIWLRTAMKRVRLSRSIPLNVQAVEDATELLRAEKLIGRPNKRNRRPEIDELNALMTWFAERDGRASIPMCELVLFAIFSARREDEICRILWADLDERRQGVLVRDMKHPRLKQDTFVFLPDEAWSVIHRQEKTDNRIFPFNGKSVSAAFTRSCSMVGIDDLCFHDLRHEGVSRLFELGWDIPNVAKVSGHKSWATLQRYTHLYHMKPYDKYQGWRWRPQLTV